jgi:Ribosomal protein L7/L12 C-terminal domain
MLAVLDFGDLWRISLIVVVLAGAGGAASSFFRPSDGARMRRLEAKIDLILQHLGLEYEDPAARGLSEEVKALAEDPAKKISAIKLHREQTGAGLREAKDAVEAYMASRGQ